MVNKHHLPKRCKIYDKDVEIDWSPIYQDNRIEHILCVLKDVTEVKKLYQKNLEESQELLILREISRLKSGDKAYQAIESCLSYVRSAIEHLEDRSRVFIELHTMKGLAMAFGFDQIASITHDVEDHIKESETVLIGKLRELTHRISQYQRICDEIYRGDDDSVAVDKSLIRKLISSLHSSDQTSGVIHTLRSLVEPNLESILETEFRSICDLAERQGKEAPTLSVNGNVLISDSRLVKDLKNVFIHLFRNSIEHGIEMPSVREQAGKSRRGRVNISASSENGFLYLRYFDDGRGLNLKRFEVIRIS